MTAPYLARATTDLATGYQPVLDATAQPWASPGSPVTLDVLTASVTEDESLSPRTQVELTVASTAAVRALDARAGIFLHLEAGYRYLDGVLDVHPWHAYLVVHELAPIPENGTVAITAYSLDTLMHLHQLHELYAEATPLDDFLEGAVLPEVIPSAWSALRAIDYGTVSPATPLTVRSMDPTIVAPPAEPLSAATEAAGAIWYADRTGLWRIAARATATGTPVHTLATGPGGTVTDYDPVLSFDGYANAVYLGYGDDSVGYAEQTTGPYRVAVAPRVTLAIKRGSLLSPSQSTRNAAALAVLRRVITYGRSEELVAAAALWVKPGDTVTIAPAGESSYARLVRRVSFRFPGGDMTLATRNPT
ncbi:hypothetical protein ABRQ22_06675 [Cellulosimicrobium sp. ES-005]|uniref:Phage tail protein n=1 Tax=Cellulosimicrobium sp. ES-005 TaxID=3163031 RepID=A0AAU8G4J2_9MICO